MQGMQSTSTPEDRQEQRPVPLTALPPLAPSEPLQAGLPVDGPLEAIKRYLDRQKNTESALTARDNDRNDGRPAWLRRWAGESRREPEPQRSFLNLNQENAGSKQEERALLDRESSLNVAEETNLRSASTTGDLVAAIPVNGYSGHSIEAAFEFETVFQFETEFEAESTEDWLDLSDELDREEIVAQESVAEREAGPAELSEVPETWHRVDGSPSSAWAVPQNANIGAARETTAQAGLQTNPGAAIRVEGRSGGELARLLHTAAQPGSSSLTAAPDPQAVRAAIFRLAQQSSLGQASRQPAGGEETGFAEVARRVWGAPAQGSEPSPVVAQTAGLDEKNLKSKSESGPVDLAQSSSSATGETAVDAMSDTQNSAGGALQPAASVTGQPEGSATEEPYSQQALPVTRSEQSYAGEREIEKSASQSSLARLANGAAAGTAMEFAAPSTSIEDFGPFALREELHRVPAELASYREAVDSASRTVNPEAASKVAASIESTDSDLARRDQQEFSDLPIDSVAGPYSRWQPAGNYDGLNGAEALHRGHAAENLPGLSAERLSVHPSKQPPQETASAGSAQGTAAAHVSSAGGPALAHDAGNLLSALKLYSELLALSGVLHARHKHFAEDLKLLATRSEVLIERLLASCTLAEQRIRGLMETASPGHIPEFAGAASDTRISSPQGLATAATQVNGGTSSGWATAEGSDGFLGGLQVGTALPVPVSAADLAEQRKDVVREVGGQPKPASHRDLHDSPQESASTSSSAIASNSTTSDPVTSDLITSGPAKSGTILSALVTSKSINTGLAMPGSAPIEPINLVDLLTRWGSLLSMIARGPVQVKFGPQAALPIPVTEEAMERILVNLVHNAMKATKNGGAIRIGVGRSEPRRAAHDGVQARAGNRMVLTVDDSGCGMTEEQIAQTMGRSRAQNSGQGLSQSSAENQSSRGQVQSTLGNDIDQSASTALSTQATTSGNTLEESDPIASATVPDPGQQRHGMGMQIVRELVALSGGELAIYSRRGVGTRIEMHWPTVREAAELARIPPGSVRSAGEGWRGAPNERFATQQTKGIGNSSGDTALNSYRKPLGDAHQGAEAGMEGAIAC